ncbi:MAG: class I SAM-dependent methyltransferase [Desulfobacteraceae bacterium]|nr:class I SAM-dependent methyltransferase [Desulfobacteraceae bacterium]
MKNPACAVVLKQGREASVARRHPWLFSGAIQRVNGSPCMGETVSVMASDGNVLAFGAYSPHSQIRVRIWTFEMKEIGPAFLRSRLECAIEARNNIRVASRTDSYRLVNAESDGLPGLIVDKYGAFVVCQFLSAGAEYWRNEIAAQINGLVWNRGIYERSDTDSRTKEGLDSRVGVISGEEPPEFLETLEGECRFLVDIRRGHKTGYYLDQRENRLAVSRYVWGREVLNCFSYTGGFGVWALKGEAKTVTNIDTSKEALELASRNVALNHLDTARLANIEGDVFKVLRAYRDTGRGFDAIILDPPKFAGTRADIEKAARGYKDINLLAFKLLRQDGLLFTFSCSGLLKPELFQKIVADAALDAGKNVQIIKRMGQAEDHPTALNFPEGTYLKGLACLVCG